MKTPMQELIEKLNNVKPNQFCSIETIRDWAESLLDKEKEIIEEAFSDGLSHYPNDSDPRYVRDYYNENFNSKER